MRTMTAVCGVVLVLCVLACGGGATRPAVKNPMSLNEFTASRTKEPMAFTLDCSLDGSRIVDGKDYWSIQVYDPDTLHGAHGYADKETDAGKQMIDAVRDGRSKRIALTIQRHDVFRGEREFVILNVGR